jgi:glycosyltransferase involved in cell wall biosynthesis
MSRLVQMHYGVMHPMFSEQLHAAPEGFSYVSRAPAAGAQPAGTKRIAQEAARFPRTRRAAERVALRGLSRAGYVHQARAAPLPNVELIHSVERLLYRSRVPYVLDFEHASLFVLYQAVALRRPWARAWLRRALSDRRLRALLPWTEAARRSLIVALGPEAGAQLQRRMVTVYPAIRPAVEPASSRGPGPLRLLFIGTAFYEKGAVEAIRATQRVAASRDVRLDIVSYAPAAWRAQLAGDPHITLHDPGPDVDVTALYRASHALIFPSHMDTLGYVVLEAMAHGLPVLAPRHLAFTELVDDGVSGLLFDTENQLYGTDTVCRFPHTLPPPASYMRALQTPSAEYVDAIAQNIMRLCDEPELHTHLARGALASVVSGRFSIDNRREALRQVYTDALA